MNQADDSSFQLLGAIQFAAQKHRSQRRKDEDASPYVNHPIEVAFLLADSGVQDLVTLQAAVLHDTLEDTHDPWLRTPMSRFSTNLCSGAKRLIIKRFLQNRQLKVHRNARQSDTQGRVILVMDDALS